ncbi:glycosyltransferase family 4 protein [Alicyclobacillus mengziensis]|uniref:Glycosyltransferase family 1 protein n=1 Tax=Alicyclobacillus mengziensis TaxID=2931921 RepID=A0A9X7Z8E0_9BACL|nr:glycosyltransferase family 1 protein [Alicyclobacillus mengziensis]QSO49517.1 glycosyltransferase family 1 protein [Alicyclobacillus mengziensis]
MRIAMFTETFLPGTDGVITRLLATLRHLSEEGHDVLIFAPAGGPETYASAKVVGLPTFRFFLYPEKPFAFPRRFVGKAIREFEPDLIHVVNPAFLGLGGIYYARKWRIPLVASFHTNVPAYARHYHLDFLEPILWWYFRSLHNRAEMNLCTSRAMQTELRRQRFKEVGLWERGVDVELYSTARASADMRQRLMGALSAAPEHRLLLYVGRLASEKGLERLRTLLDRDERIHLAIVGDGPHRRPLEQVFAGSNTVFTGYLHGHDLAEAYVSADAFVFPSTTETLGLVLFEAMAAGLPIMAADSEPTREVLENGAAGIIFNAADPMSMQAAVDSILYDNKVRSMVTERGHQIASDLDWAGPTRQLIGHYQRVLANQVKVGRAVHDGRG